MAKKDDHNQTTDIPLEASAEQTANTDSRIDELTSDLQRIQADFVNFKRRSESEKSELLDFAKIRVVREFLSVRDNFDRELANRPADLQDSPWAASIDSIRASFDSVLKGLGVERFDSVGQIFDPHLHEAISSDGDGEVVAEELQPGYKLGDTVIRHAIVKVGNTPMSDTAADEANPAQTGDDKKGKDNEL